MCYETLLNVNTLVMRIFVHTLVIGGPCDGYTDSGYRYTDAGDVHFDPNNKY